MKLVDRPLKQAISSPAIQWDYLLRGAVKVMTYLLITGEREDVVDLLTLEQTSRATAALQKHWLCTLQSFDVGPPPQSALFCGLPNALREEITLASAQLFYCSGFGLEEVLTPRSLYCGTYFLETDVQTLKAYHVKALRILNGLMY